MTPDLPPALRAAIDAQLEGVARGDLALRAQRTSQAYRAGKPSSGVIRDAADALAYALTRLPATYAASVTVLAEAARMTPGFRPASLLDAGAGTGAASWAAETVWPGLEVVDWVDASPPFLALASSLAAGGPAPLRTATATRADLTDMADLPAADLVVASYALAEIAPGRQLGVIAGLWAAARGLLVMVEPGTPAGYSRMLSARDALIAAGANILAPCPHHSACPLAGADWCHFSVRLPRSRDHRQAKGADVPFEDERFAYLIAARSHLEALARAPRILAPPRAGKPGIDLKLCGEAGVEQRFVGRRDKPAHARARRLGWGDTF